MTYKFSQVKADVRLFLVVNSATSEINYNPMAGHTCEGFFFLIASFEVGRSTSNPDL